MEAADSLLGVLVRLIGLLWAIGSVAIIVQVRREAMFDGMLSKLSSMADEIEADAVASDPGFEPAARDAHRLAHQAWEDADDRARRRWLAIQAVLLGATGLGMAALHPFAVWMVAAVIAAQGLYFFWRERVSRSAPTPELAAGAKPAASTVNAGWFSLAAGVLVWAADARGLLGAPT